MSPQLAAALTGIVGICMVAGWITAFRNRAYLGFLGLAFLILAGSLSALARARAAQEIGEPSAQMVLLTRVLLAACLLSFLLAVVTAAQETARRLREIRTGYREAEEAMLEMVKASLEKEEESESSNVEGPPEENK